MKRKSSKTLLCFENINYGAAPLISEDAEKTLCEDSDSSSENDRFFQSPYLLRKAHSNFDFTKDSPSKLTRKFSDVFRNDSKERFLDDKLGKKRQLSLWQPLANVAAGGLLKNVFQKDKRDVLLENKV